MKHIEDDVRKRIAEYIPDAIDKVIKSHEKLLSSEEKDCKAFKDLHDACKVGIAHVELLLKLAKWADVPDPAALEQQRQRVIQEEIARAKLTLEKPDEETDE